MSNDLPSTAIDESKLPEEFYGRRGRAGTDVVHRYELWHVPRYESADEGTSADASNRRTSTEHVVSATVDRLYPHLFGQDEAGARGLSFLRAAIVDMDAALVAFSAPDLEEMVSKMTAAAANLRAAQDQLRFSRPMHALTAHLRRAALNTSIEVVTFAALNRFLATLRRAAMEPTLDFSDAADLISELEADGWRGELALVDELAQFLLTPGEAFAEEPQAHLFDAAPRQATADGR